MTVLADTAEDRRPLAIICEVPTSPLNFAELWGSRVRQDGPTLWSSQLGETGG